jgi:hypothetical protein
VKTYIFWETSDPLRFFSYCASMACCSCLTSFAYDPQENISEPCVSFSYDHDLFNGELFVSFNSNFPCLLGCLLLNERDLIVCRKGWVRLVEIRRRTGPDRPSCSTR